MTRSQAYLVAERLYFNSTNNPLCNRRWLFTIYKSLLISNSNENKKIEWTKYNQWNIDHNCRAAKANALKEKVVIDSFRLNFIDDDVVQISVIFLVDNLKTESITCIFERSSFIDEFWKVQNPKGDTILLSRYEGEQLFEASIFSLNELENDKSQSTKKRVHLTKGDTERTSKDNVRKMKFRALNSLLDQIRETYHKIKEPTQRSYFETVIGAAIFYLPSLNSHFNGFISLNALKEYLNGQRRVKDHIYPRKLAAIELLKEKMTLDELEDRYHSQLATFMYMTSSENIMLVNYYESYNSHDEAMQSLGIEKFPLNPNEKFESHIELDKFIETIDKKTSKHMSSKEFMQLLRAFRMN
jgi:hypothetical protein